MILPDTSAWIERDRQTGSSVAHRLSALVRWEMGVVVTEPVVMEVLAGARTEKRAQDLSQMLSSFDVLQVRAEDFESSARIYRSCRRVGVTPRGLLDCLIAAIAWRNGATMLSNDKDMVRIAGVMGVDLDPASR